MKEKDLYRLALVTWGPEAQTLMVMEKIGVIGINCGIEGSR